MYQLWLDIGNTRLKYWLMQNQQVIEHEAALHLQSPADLLLGLSTFFKRYTIEKIGISSVLDQATNQNMHAILSPICPKICFAAVQQNFDGFQTQYAVEQLGIDRWLQLLAISDQYNQCCVVGCGTALTIDIVSDQNHCGGYILPNIYLQRDTLFKGTKGIPFSQHAFESLNLGQNTSDAVHHGILLGLVAAVETTLKKFNHHQLVLTGGDATLFAEHLAGFQPIVDKDLLLNGLQSFVNHKL